MLKIANTQVITVARNMVHFIADITHGYPAAKTSSRAVETEH
ncbi:hypothetical protein [Buttiauxella sp. B2]|nr:hypothetical protein [Buttiauxella sp. B2]